MAGQPSDAAPGLGEFDAPVLAGTGASMTAPLATVGDESGTQTTTVPTVEAVQENSVLTKPENDAVFELGVQPRAEMHVILWDSFPKHSSS